MSYYVYELVDPRTNTVFYVGKGKKSRVKAHEVEAKKGVSSLKCDRIREIWADGFEVTNVRVASFSDEQDAYDFEAARICEYGLNNLTNIAPGGGGVRGAPTIYHDRVVVRAAAECINRTGNGSIKGVLINGSYLDLVEILKIYKERAFEVISRRGLQWSNEISVRFGVEFSHG